MKSRILGSVPGLVVAGTAMVCGHFVTWEVPGISALSAAAQTTDSGMSTAERAQAALQTLRDPASPEQTRSEAAGVLLTMPQDQAGRVAIEFGLRLDEPAGSRRAIAAALQVARSPWKELIPALSEALDRSVEKADVAEVLAVVGGFGVYSSRDAFESLWSAYSRADVLPPSVRQAMVDAMAAQTGRYDLGSDVQGWSAWWEENRWLGSDQWESMIRASQIRAARQGQRESQASADRLAGVYKRLHAMTAEDSRPTLVREMLAAPDVPVRRAAFELIMVALVNAKTVSEDVAKDATSRLSDPDATVRAQAARVVELLDRAESHSLLMTALERESSPIAAAAMLRAAARRPSEAVVDAAFRWLETADPSEAAIEALLACARSEFLPPGPKRDRLRQFLESEHPVSRTQNALMLAVVIGDSDRVAHLLKSNERELVLAAANALAERESGLGALLAAAMEDPQLFDAAMRGLRRFQVSAEGLAIAQRLPTGNQVRKDESLRALARALSPEELRQFASVERDQALRESVLASVVTPEFFATTTDLPERVEIALMLVQTRLELNRPAEALALIDQLPSDWHGPLVVSLRITALVCLERYEDADDAARDADSLLPENDASEVIQAWISAVETCRDEQTGERRRNLFVRFGGSLSDEQLQRLQQSAAKDAPHHEGPPAP